MANPATPPSFEAELKALYMQYAQSLPGRVDKIMRLWEQFVQAPNDWPLCETLQRLTHTLAGSGATFGFEAVSVVARTADNHLKTLLAGKTTPTITQCAQIQEVLQELARVSQALYTKTMQERLGSNLLPNMLMVEQHRSLFICDSDAATLQDLRAQLSDLGYAVRLSTDFADLRAALQFETPSALMIDLACLPQLGSESDRIAQFQNDLPQAPPLIFMSAHDDIASRLLAVRLKGKAYFTKPVDINLLLDKLENLTTTQHPEPLRVMVVDDSRVTTEICRMVLERAGMEVVTVEDPFTIMSPLVEFKPDLILLDINMPGCRGDELVEVIRQQDTFGAIPIVYLSGESSIDAQSAAMMLGVEGFLIKPIRPDQLVDMVTMNGQRFRVLRSLISHDSLTGLLNHAATKDRLRSELARAERQGTELAVALLDLDDFKQINEAFGYSAGNSVLKSLSQRLQRRLRRSDVIGRYEGEEFAIVFPDTGGDDAMRLLNAIRDNFARLRQQATAAEFQVTFSGGVATFPMYQRDHDLLDAAYKALYQAKQHGKNRIVLALAEPKQPS